jgi:hypothetical protein
LLGGCDPEGSCAGGESQIFVINVLRSAPVDDGISEGFNLDGRVSDESDLGSCGVVDFTHPDGTPGIDNSMGKILSALAVVGGAAVEDLVADAIASGEFLILYALSGVDDLHNDSCVELSILRATGTPDLDAAGRVLAGQTFDRQGDVAPVIIPGLALEDGLLTTRGFEMPVSTVIFDTVVDFDLHDAALELQIDQDLSARGVLAGTVLAEDMRRTGGDIDAGVSAAVDAAVEHNADLMPDNFGVCGGVSTTLLFEAVPAFLFP